MRIDPCTREFIANLVSCHNVSDHFFQIVYVARNAKDNAVSYFHFDQMNMAEPEPGDWNTFLQNFIEGKRK